VVSLGKNFTPVPSSGHVPVFPGELPQLNTQRVPVQRGSRGKRGRKDGSRKPDSGFQLKAVFDNPLPILAQGRFRQRSQDRSFWRPGGTLVKQKERFHPDGMERTKNSIPVK
jgi:hypothetical protein